MNQHDCEKSELISTTTLKRIIALLYLLLPPVVVFANRYIFDEPQQPSLSEYFYTSSSTFFVGSAFALGILFLAYKGYPTNYGPIPISDNALANTAGTGAIVSALIPSNTCIANMPNHFWGSEFWGNVHLLGALTAFTCTGLLILFYFTQTSGELTRAKIMRNRVYITCGIITFAGIILMAIIKFTRVPTCDIANQIGSFMIIESIMLWAFALAWAVKADLIMRD